MPLAHFTGNTQSSSGADFIKLCQEQKATATLVLESAKESALLLLRDGRIQKHYSLNTALDIDTTHLNFIYYQHENRGHLELPSRFPSSNSALMRAVPTLSENELELPQESDLNRALKMLIATDFSGYVRLEQGAKQAFMLYSEGEIASALVEENGNLTHDNDALRNLRAMPLEAAYRLARRHLPESILDGLLALAANNFARGMHVFNGLESNEAGYTFFKDGRALFRTSVELVGQAGYYPKLMDAPVLSMPDEPPGWEHKHYSVTLRGQDALNVITDLAMQFEREYGKEGKRVLQCIAYDQTPEELAEHLNLNLTGLKTWLDKLELEGLIRQRN